MTERIWDVPHRIETERLVLRRYVAADAEQLAEVVPRNIAHLERFMEWIAYEPQTVEQRRAWIEDDGRQFDSGKDFTLGIFDLGGTLIGGTGFHVRTDPERLEIGYWIDADHEGRGLVTEAVAALTRVGLEYSQAPVVGIVHAPANERSATIPRRLGYVLQAHQGEACHDTAEKVPSVVWWATSVTLATEPLASTPRPVLFGAHGERLVWPL